MTMLRVLRAASTSIFLSAKVFGGVSVTSLPFHSTRMPMLWSTSMMRCTSSMRGTWRSVVLPLFMRDAQRSPTAPFLEVEVTTVPLSFLPPSMARFIEPGERVMRFFLSARPSFLSMSALTFCFPLSMRAMALCVVLSNFASSPCVIPCVSRKSAICCPIAVFIYTHNIASMLYLKVLSVDCKK